MRVLAVVFVCAMVAFGPLAVSAAPVPGAAAVGASGSVRDSGPCVVNSAAKTFTGDCWFQQGADCEVNFSAHYYVGTCSETPAPSPPEVPSGSCLRYVNGEPVYLFMCFQPGPGYHCEYDDG